MVIWKDVWKAIIIRKIWHIHKPSKHLHRDFTTTEGDVPVVRYNNITDKIEEVVNIRGNAYAHRNAKRYRKRNDF